MVTRILRFHDNSDERRILDYIDRRNKIKYPTLMSYIGAAVEAFETGISGRTKEAGNELGSYIAESVEPSMKNRKIHIEKSRTMADEKLNFDREKEERIPKKAMEFLDSLKSNI